MEEGFMDYITDEATVSFPWSMIDKITPRPDEGIAKELDVHPYRVKKTLETVSKYSLEDISKVLDELSKLDVDIKTGKIEDKTGFELFLLRVTGGKAWNR